MVCRVSEITSQVKSRQAQLRLGNPLRKKCRAPLGSARSPVLFPQLTDLRTPILLSLLRRHSRDPSDVYIHVIVITCADGLSHHQASKHYHTLLAGGLWPALTHPYKHGSRRDLWISSNSHQGKSSASHVVPPQRRVDRSVGADRGGAPRPHKEVRDRHRHRRRRRLPEALRRLAAAEHRAPRTPVPEIA